MKQKFLQGFSREDIRQKIEACYAWLLAKESYEASGPVSERKKAALLEQCNLAALPPGTADGLAVTVRRSNLRNLPSLELWTDEPGYFLTDLLQGTAVDPGEPLAVLHTSADGSMYFVVMRNYCGWIKAADVALATQEQLLSYAQPEKFLVVTANRVTVAGKLYQLGAILPLCSTEQMGWRVLVPERDEQGRLQSRGLFLPFSASLHQGWLAPTRDNLLRMALGCLGDKYDWGGMTDSVDCSSFVADVYRTAGIELPRDADEQEAAALQSIPFTDTEERRLTLRQAEPGDLLFRDGHVMMYLGEKDGVPRMIHAYARCRENGVVKSVRKVAVTEIDYTLVTGESNLNALTSIGKYLQ